MACSCITTFNYSVEFQDCNTIIYNDMSVWVEVPETYTIVITYSGGTLTQVVSTSESTIIEGNFPSGVYCIAYTDCNGDVIKSEFLNTCKIECALKEKMYTISACMMDPESLENKEKWDQILLIKKYIDLAKAKFDCEWCDICDITKFIDLANKELNGCTCNKA